MSQIKVIMEEAVTRKFVHEESAQVLSLCGKNTFSLHDKIFVGNSTAGHLLPKQTQI